jgi:hypothetical protein
MVRKPEGMQVFLNSFLYKCNEGRNLVMKQHISSLYRKIVPEKTRKVIYKAFLGDLLMLIRDFSGTMKWYRCKLYYSIFSPKNEIEQAL